MTTFEVKFNITKEERFILLSLADHARSIAANDQFRTVARKLLHATEEAKKIEDASDEEVLAAILREAQEINDRLRMSSLTSLPYTKSRSVQWGVVEDSDTFDRVILWGAKNNYITLHEHDHPSGVSPNERKAMVKDSKNRYYIGMVLEPKGIKLIS